MIRMVTGLMGGGKTYFMTKKQVEELRYTERLVATNCREMDFPRINEYLQEQMALEIEAGTREPVDLHTRSLLIPREGVFEFFRYRSGGLVLPPPPGRDTIKPWSRKAFDYAMNNFYRDRETWELARPGDPPSGIGYFEKVADPRHPEWGKPTTYFLTEFHDFFNAQDWQDVGPATQYYISKHRHLHDELVFETQMPEQVDAACRRLVEQTFVIENHYTRSFGPFKNRGCFKAKVYFKTQTKVPYDAFEFQLDAKGIGSCYKTTGALGIMDRGTETRSKGFGLARAKLPWWALWVGGAVAAGAIFWVISMIPGLFGSMLGGMLNGTTSAMSEKVQPQAGERKRPQGQGTAQAGPPGGSMYVNPSPAKDVQPAPIHVHQDSGPRISHVVKVTGIVQQGRRITIALSDGRTYTEADPELAPDSGARVDRHSVTIDGVRYFFAKPLNVYPRNAPTEARSPGQPGQSVRGENESNSDYPSENRVSTNDENSAWYRAPDGTYRLKNPDTPATAFRPSFSFAPR